MGGLTKFKQGLAENNKSLEVKKETIRNIVTGNFYQLMKEEGKSKADLARLMNVSKPAITDLLSGDRNFTVDMLTAVSHFLNRVPNISFDKNNDDFFEKKTFSWSCTLEKEETMVESENDFFSKKETVRYLHKMTRIHVTGDQYLTKIE
jgi:transcriptional regulator with XRE-family HTH domain